MTNEVIERPSSAFVSIEGGRAIAARDILGHFAKSSDEVSTGTENMAGYYIIAWDDQGFMTTAYRAGRRNPYANAILPDAVTQRLKQDLAGASA